jgi:predicted oxidoreductase
MRIDRLTGAELDALIRSDLDAGISFFEHADIYGGNGRCEELFGNILREDPSLRERMTIQTKCGIRPGQYDFSKEHILTSVEQSLKRLGTEQVEFLVLHRPDTLVEPEEVAEAFAQLKEQGKVKKFGVSNHNAMQIALLNKYLPEPLVIDQLQFGLGHTVLVDAGLNVNMKNDESVNRDDSTLDFCRLNDITIQAWSPLQFGFIKGHFMGNPDFEGLNRKLEELGEAYGITATAMAIAWILRHSAKIQPIVGSVNLERMRDIAKAADVTITRKEWYDLYCATGKSLP